MQASDAEAVRHACARLGTECGTRAAEIKGRGCPVVSPGDPRHKASSGRELRRAHVRGVVPEGWGSRTYQSARLKGERWPLSAIGSI